MPSNKTDINSKNRFARAKRKLKDIGIGVAATIATLAPLKGAAQDRVIDADAKTVSLVLDTIGAAMTVVNKSSPKKVIYIHNGGFGDVNQFVKDKADTSRASAIGIANEDDRCHTLLKGTVVKKGDNTYEYNTDRLYDKYFEMAHLVFPKSKMSGPVYMKVYLVGTMDQVVLFGKSKDGQLSDCFGTMILDGVHDMILHYKKFDKKTPGNGTESDLTLVLYKSKKDKDKRTLRVYDADKHMGHVYKITGDGGLVKAYQVSEHSKSSMVSTASFNEYWHRGLNSPYRY